MGMNDDEGVRTTLGGGAEEKFDGGLPLLNASRGGIMSRNKSIQARFIVLKTLAMRLT